MIMTLLTETAAAGADTDSKGTVLAKVGGHDGDAGYEHHACTDAEAETLSEEYLVVMLRQAGHHHAEDDEKRSHAEEGAGVTSIENGPREYADEKEQGGLNGANPRDGRRRVRAKQVNLIKSLVRAKGVNDAPGCELG